MCVCVCVCVCVWERDTHTDGDRERGMESMSLEETAWEVNVSCKGSCMTIVTKMGKV